MNTIIVTFNVFVYFGKHPVVRKKKSRHTSEPNCCIPFTCTLTHNQRGSRLENHPLEQKRIARKQWTDGWMDGGERH